MNWQLEGKRENMMNMNKYRQTDIIMTEGVVSIGCEINLYG
jgi:hypothetical protein